MKKIKLRHVNIIGWISFMLCILLILLADWLRLFWLLIIALFEMLAAIIFLAIFDRGYQKKTESEITIRLEVLVNA